MPCGDVLLCSVPQVCPTSAPVRLVVRAPAWGPGVGRARAARQVRRVLLTLVRAAVRTTATCW
ncbi:hypothetical protein ACFPM0_18985 [Pseudonocardia sulfidoxydans]|uniref:hypothetical protein n=1 Tax=Pseudonocardia sulfidoxydans TaxID=54011 RepID=UPI0036240BF9